MNRKNVLIFILMFILVFSYCFFVGYVFFDEIWNYGFSYNISRGMIPYKDFNLIITPLYPMFASLFIRLFGNYLYSFYLFNSLIVSFILFYFYKIFGKKSLLIMPLVIFNSHPGYNIFSLFIMVILFLLLDSKIKYRDVLIGLLVGFSFLNKQTIGICLFIPMIYYSKNKLKSFASFMIPIMIFIIYLVYNQAIYQFIDYCFLGLFEFGGNNSILFYLPFEIVVIIWLIYRLFKSKFKDKECFYILMFQVITGPIFDDYHFIIGFIPVFYYILKYFEFKEYKFKYYLIIVWFVCLYFYYGLHYDYKVNLNMNKNSYLYGRNISKAHNKFINNIVEYINNYKNDYDYVYFFSADAYLIKLYIDYPLSKYDLINNGNMGYHGDVKYISEVDNYCKKHKCMFIMCNHVDNWQTNKRIINYVKDNYVKFDEVDRYDIYRNG